MTNATLLRRFFAYYRPHRALFLLDFSCAIVSGLLELGFPLAVRSFVDRLLPGHDWGLITAWRRPGWSASTWSTPG